MSSMVMGRILGVTGAQAVVLVDGEELPPVQLARHLQGSGGAGPGDACVVSSIAGALVVTAVLGATAAPPDPTPGESDAEAQAPSPDRSGSDPVSPVWTGTYRDGWRTDTSDLYQGDWTGRGINHGAAYFGRGFQAWDVLTRVSVRLRRRSGAGVSAAQTPTMTLLAGGTRPTGAPTVLATAAGPSITAGGESLWTVPDTWLSRLSGGEAGGIGITSGSSRDPYIALSASGGGMTATAFWEDT